MDDIKPAPKPKPTDNTKPVNDVEPATPITDEVTPTVTPDSTDSYAAEAPTSGETTSTEPVTPAAATPSATTDDAVEEDVPAAVSEQPQTQSIVTNTGRPDHHKSVIVVLLLVILAALASGAYFFLNKDKIASSNTPTSAAAVVTKKDIPNLRYVTANTGWDKFYPGIDSSANYDESNREIFEGLVRFDGGTKIVPLLATSWTNPDPSTWVFKLKPGVKFHTGRTMTADDVKLSFEDSKDSDYTQPFNDTIASVTVDNPLQVTIKTTRPDATLLNKLTNLYIYDTTSGKQNDPINGTGAYTIKPGTTAKTDSLELVAFDDYHGGRPHVRSVSYIGLSDNDDGKAYGENKADLTSVAANPTGTNGRKYDEMTPQPLGVRILGLNSQKAGSPLQNVKVRQALYDSLDPKLIAKAHGVTAYSEATQLVPKAVPGYNPDITRPKTDVAAAKQLLTQAGYPNGFTMKLSYFKTSTVEAEASEIAKEAAQAGITIQLDPQTDASVLGSMVFGGKTDSYVNTQTTDILDASDVLTTLTSTIPGYKNQQVTDLITKAQSTLDSTKHISYLQQANKAMMDDVGYIPLYVPTDQYIYIHNPSYVMQQDIQNNNLGVYFWKVYAE